MWVCGRIRHTQTAIGRLQWHISEIRKAKTSKLGRKQVKRKGKKKETERKRRNELNKT
jgi:hypothetical protein